MIVIVFTVLMMSAINGLDAAPPEPSLCKAEMQHDGSYVFPLSPDDSTNLISDCEPQIIINGAVSAEYINGELPASLLPPVLRATMFNFTLSNCSKSVKIGLDCPHLWPFKDLQCSCDSSTSTAQASSSTAKPPPSTSNSARSLHDMSRFPVGAVVGCGVFVISIFAFSVFIWRKRTKGRLMKPRIASTSASGSDEDLVDSLTDIP
ncbi:uncharacterized protein LOC134083044 isoform X2 [Sardina pilchardus]|uniref:uncharacterized protein LOC134083044 isoform X2 n=1 Tax=Sardina pilchardus TaxID=27697 RepID=UPI002E0F4A51